MVILSPPASIIGSSQFAAGSSTDAGQADRAVRRSVARCTIDADLGDVVEILAGEDVGMRGELVNVWDRNGERTFVVEISPDEIRMATRILLIKKA